MLRRADQRRAPATDAGDRYMREVREGQRSGDGVGSESGSSAGGYVQLLREVRRGVEAVAVHPEAEEVERECIVVHTLGAEQAGAFQATDCLARGLAEEHRKHRPATRMPSTLRILSSSSPYGPRLFFGVSSHAPHGQQQKPPR